MFVISYSHKQHAFLCIYVDVHMVWTMETLQVMLRTRPGDSLIKQRFASHFYLILHCMLIGAWPIFKTN